MWCPLLAMSVALTDAAEGEGGFVIVRGSHKSNFPAPVGLKEYRQFTEHSYQPAVKAGDVIFFSEVPHRHARPSASAHEPSPGVPPCTGSREADRHHRACAPVE